MWFDGHEFSLFSKGKPAMRLDYDILEGPGYLIGRLHWGCPEFC